MKISKRKARKVFGKGVDKTVFFRKDIETLNFHPYDYDNSPQWKSYINSSERIYRQIVKKTSPDDLCYDMFNSLIDANAMNEVSAAKQQYTNHLLTIDHFRGIINGQLLEAQLIRDTLTSDIDEIDSQLNALNKNHTYNG